MKLFTLLVSAGFLVTASVSHASDIRIDYDVDAKALKDGAPAGTMLTFGLYSDAACTSEIGNDVVDVADASVKIESLKLAKASQATVKPPKVSRLNYVMTGVTPTADVYAKVTGTGIAAIGGDCQPQAATAELPASEIVDGAIVDADVAPGAAISESKLDILGAILAGATTASLPVGARFAGIAGETTVSSTESDVVMVVAPLGCSATNFTMQTSVPPAGNLLGAVSVNGAPSALGCTISGPASTSCSSFATVSIPAGARVSIRLLSVILPFGPGRIMYAFECR